MNWAEKAGFVKMGVIARNLIRTALIISVIPMILEIPASVPLLLTQVIPPLVMVRVHGVVNRVHEVVNRVSRTLYSLRLRHQSLLILPICKIFMSFSTKAPTVFLSLPPIVRLTMLCFND